MGRSQRPWTAWAGGLALLCCAAGARATSLALAAEEASLRTPAGCEGEVPERTVLLTYTNGHHFDLLLLHRSVAAEAGLRCLEARTVTICLDDECARLCRQHGVSCVRYSEYSIGAAETRRERNYRTITFIKWLMLLEVSGSVSASLFYDDDVVFFANPFGAFEPSVADFRHQTESGSGCAARPNGGLLYVRSSPQGVELLRHMVARKDEIEASGDRLDQDYVVAAAEAAGVSRCALPKREFAGHCRHAQEKRGQVGQLVTYHAHCCALAASKQALVRRVQAAREETPARPLREVDLEPLPGFDRVNDTCYKPTWGDLKALRGSLRGSMRGSNEAGGAGARPQVGGAGSGRPEGHLR